MAEIFPPYPASCSFAHYFVASSSSRQEGWERRRRDGSGRSNSEGTRAEAAARERKSDFPPLPYGGPRGQVQPTKISLFCRKSKANTKPCAPNVGAYIGESCYADGTAVIEKGQHLAEELEMQRPDGGLRAASKTMPSRCEQKRVHRLQLSDAVDIGVEVRNLDHADPFRQQPAKSLHA